MKNYKNIFDIDICCIRIYFQIANYVESHKVVLDSGLLLESANRHEEVTRLLRIPPP
jgi:hypothetical protein